MIRLGAELNVFHVWENAFGGYSARTNDGHLWMTETNGSAKKKSHKSPELLDLRYWFHARAVCDRCVLVNPKQEKRETH